MLPYLQIDENDSSLYLTDANKIVNLKYNAYTYQFDNRLTQSFHIFPTDTDVQGFMKKDDYLLCFSQYVITF